LLLLLLLLLIVVVVALIRPTTGGHQFTSQSENHLGLFPTSHTHTQPLSPSVLVLTIFLFFILRLLVVSLARTHARTMIVCIHGGGVLFDSFSGFWFGGGLRNDKEYS